MIRPLIVDGWDFTQVLTAGEVAARFRVHPSSVTYWAVTGRLVSVRTLGGHRRYSKQQVDYLRNGRS